MFARGKYSLAICDRCGLRCLYTSLRKQTINKMVTNTKVCPDCLDKDSERWDLSRVRVNDPEALREPRPDNDDDGTTTPLDYPYTP